MNTGNEKTGKSRIDIVLARLKDKAIFHPIMRYQYNVPATEGLEIVEAIGKMRNPKFVIDRENRFTYENIIKWVHGDRTAQALNPETHETIPANMKAGIYIAGNTGTGKSWCMEIIREYICAMAFNIQINGDDRLLSFPIVRADDITAAFMHDGTLERFRDMDILCIQDVGTESRETLYMGNRMEVIRSLLEWRADNGGKLTMITSNIPCNHPQFTERYGDRVTSRMREICNYYEIKGKDRRKL